MMEGVGWLVRMHGMHVFFYPFRVTDMFFCEVFKYV